MTVVAGFNRTKRPYFFTSASGTRVEFPAFATGQGDLVTNQLREFNMYVSARQISATVPATIPVNTVLPVITGTAQVGVTLTTTNGTWTGTAPTYARQWKAAGVNISGATATTYVPAVGDVGKVITCTVTATNAAGSVSATSAATSAVIAA